MANQKKKFPTRKTGSVKISNESLGRYRELSELTMIPISILIEKAMKNSDSLFQEYGDKLRKGLADFKLNEKN